MGWKREGESSFTMTNKKQSLTMLRDTVVCGINYFCVKPIAEGCEGPLLSHAMGHLHSHREGRRHFRKQRPQV